MDLALIKSGYQAYKSRKAGAAPQNLRELAQQLEPQQIAGYAIGIFSDHPSSCTLSSMQNSTLPNDFYDLLDAVSAITCKDFAQAPKFEALVAATLWQFGEMMSLAGEPRATTESKKAIARAFSDAPSFSGDLRHLLIDLLSDADKYFIAKNPAPAALEFGGCPKYISKDELQSIVDYITLDQTAAAPNGPKRSVQM